MIFPPIDARVCSWFSAVASRLIVGIVRSRSGSSDVVAADRFLYFMCFDFDSECLTQRGTDCGCVRCSYEDRWASMEGFAPVGMYY